MSCKPTPTKKNDQWSENQQEHRKTTRKWKNVIEKFSSPNIAPTTSSAKPCNIEKEFKYLPKEEPLLNPKLQEASNLKGKSFGKKKSPLQKFDEIVTRELKKHRSNEKRLQFLDDTKGLLNCPPNKLSLLEKSKLGFDAKVSITVVEGLGKEVKDMNKDPTQDEDPVLIDAIEKLAEAQAMCRFKAAVKAAEEITASVPPEMAEEAAVACARDYQSEILDEFHEEVPMTESQKPIEVIGYIGITKPNEKNSNV